MIGFDLENEMTWWFVNANYLSGLLWLSIIMNYMINEEEWHKQNIHLQKWKITNKKIVTKNKQIQWTRDVEAAEAHLLGGFYSQYLYYILEAEVALKPSRFYIPAMNYY